MAFPYRDETKEMNSEARQNAGGSFIELPDGITHYQIGGPEAGEPVILIHGFSVPYFVYDPTFGFLTRSGFRVIRYDLFGRGFSDRPPVQYDLDLFLKQLTDLLDALDLTQPVSLIGLSMGGPIAAAFAARNPHRVNKLVLIGPLGAKPVALSPILKTLKMPLIGEIGFNLAGSDRMVKNMASDFFDPALIEHFRPQYKVQMQYKGFKRAILSTMRGNMLDSFIDIYQRLGKMNKHILLLWGRNDSTVPFEHSRELCAALPNIQFHVVENCGHIPHYEKPDDVNPILLEFLKANASKIS